MRLSSEETAYGCVVFILVAHRNWFVDQKTRTDLTGLDWVQLRKVYGVAFRSIDWLIDWPCLFGLCLQFLLLLQLDKVDISPLQFVTENRNRSSPQHFIIRPRKLILKVESRKWNGGIQILRSCAACAVNWVSSINKSIVETFVSPQVESGELANETWNEETAYGCVVFIFVAHRNWFVDQKTRTDLTGLDWVQPRKLWGCIPVDWLFRSIDWLIGHVYLASDCNFCCFCSSAKLVFRLSNL